MASAYPTVPVIILTGHGTIESAVEAMRAGAYDFLTKPVNLDRLELLVKRALSRRQLVLENLSLQQELQRRSSSSQVVTASRAMRNVFEVVEQVAPTRASVLITGESGVGKEVVADAIHALSPRSGARFVKVHCAALTETLLESELFGHERGAFTGRRGSPPRAASSSPTAGPSSSTRSERSARAFRSSCCASCRSAPSSGSAARETITVDARVVTATNRELKAEIDHGTFREDLYYRLNVVHIDVPPLRERQADVPLLTAGFLKEAAEENGKELVGIEPAALTVLQRYAWPGNVRELRNCIESAVVMARGHHHRPPRPAAGGAQCRG